MIKALRGMKDFLPPQSEKFEYFVTKSSQIAKRFGFSPIETPILEETSLFKRSVGESSDIVGKEMYQFTDKGGNDVCLRPEGTAGVVRSFIENKLDRKGGVYRFYYFGPMFRYERPQKGRLREFHQFGIEVFGEESVMEDVNVIALAKEILDFFNISYTLKINSLGCKECMPSYRENLILFLKDIEDGLCEDCKRRIYTNPIRVYDCKNASCQNILHKGPRITDFLCETCDKDFQTLTKTLKELQIDYEIDKNLVRGLDYYTKTAFEFTSNELGAQNAIAGGGRYDKLVEFLGGKPTPAIGFAIGIERILELIKIPEKKRKGYYFAALTSDALLDVIKEGMKKREEEKVYIEYKVKSLKAHLKSADRLNVRYCAVIGEDELKNGVIWIKDLEEKSEKFQKIGE